MRQSGPAHSDSWKLSRDTARVPPASPHAVQCGWRMTGYCQCWLRLQCSSTPAKRGRDEPAGPILHVKVSFGGLLGAPMARRTGWPAYSLSAWPPTAKWPEDQVLVSSRNEEEDDDAAAAASLQEHVLEKPKAAGGSLFRAQRGKGRGRERCLAASLPRCVSFVYGPKVWSKKENSVYETREPVGDDAHEGRAVLQWQLASWRGLHEAPRRLRSPSLRT
eukprot:TRINITY_DN1908_c0_g1_i1.p1 TRINITY_DN1908_c0_g1~~TRINITY_DN1908_c0_g1_i1.p1  ORF type:complete len:219 (-),score=-34.66 TRINITY_DN1908_c0_g1_i1:366-1022(-)